MFEHKSPPDHNQNWSLKMANKTVTQSEAHDNLTAKLAQLKAMLAMTFGGAMEAFNGLTDAVRDDYLSACSDLTDDCLSLAAAITPAP